MNVKRLEAVRDHILNEPKRFAMEIYGAKMNGDNAPACGTVACIAGWTVILQKPEVMTNAAHLSKAMQTAESRAIRLLAITREQAVKLFHHRHWPKRFRDLYERADRHAFREGKALAGAERIDYFIKTGK